MSPFIICHAPSERCFGCDHYRGKTAVCKYAPAETIASVDTALRCAAAIARANTSAPRIWQDGAWHNPHGEDIAVKIEAMILSDEKVRGVTEEVTP